MEKVWKSTFLVKSLGKVGKNNELTLRAKNIGISMDLLRPKYGDGQDFATKEWNAHQDNNKGYPANM